MPKQGKAPRRPQRRLHSPTPEEAGNTESPDQILVLDQPDRTYDLLHRLAEKEGRVDGPHHCPTCGMRHHTQPEAEGCCRKVRRSPLPRMTQRRRPKG